MFLEKSLIFSIRYEALEARLRGRFASIFKLSGGGEPTEDLQANTESVTETTKHDDTDDDEFDIDDISEDEGVESNVKYGPGNTLKNETEATGGFSKETLKRFGDTRVRFTHASIRDFIVQKRDFHLDAHTGSIPIHIDARLADLRIAQKCMNRIIKYGTNFNETAAKPDYINYSNRAWGEHLKSADEIGLADSEKAEVVKTIVTLFTDPTACHGWVLGMANCSYFAKMLHMFKNPTFALMIGEKWLPVAEQDDYTPEQWDWIQKSMASSKELFRPLARAAAGLWLTRTGPDDPLFEQSFHFTFFLWIVWAWALLDDHGFSGTESLDLSPLFSWKYPKFNEETFQKVVNSFGFDKTQYWYSAQGWLLYYSEQTDRGAELFSKALEIDPLFWSALGGLGYCWKHDKFDDASEMVEKAIRNIPSSLSAMGAQLKSTLMCFLVERQDYEAVSKVAAEAYTPELKSNGLFQMKMVYIMSLYELKQYDRIHEIMLDLSRLSVFDGMIQFCGLLTISKEIGVSLRMHGDIVKITKPWAEEMCSISSTQTMSRTTPWAFVWLAMFSMFDQNIWCKILH